MSDAKTDKFRNITDRLNNVCYELTTLEKEISTLASNLNTAAGQKLIKDGAKPVNFNNGISYIGLGAAKIMKNEDEFSQALSKINQKIGFENQTEIESFKDQITNLSQETGFSNKNIINLASIVGRYGDTPDELMKHIKKNVEGNIMGGGFLLDGSIPQTESQKQSKKKTKAVVGNVGKLLKNVNDSMQDNSKAGQKFKTYLKTTKQTSGVLGQVIKRGKLGKFIKNKNVVLEVLNGAVEVLDVFGYIDPMMSEFTSNFEKHSGVPIESIERPLKELHGDGLELAKLTGASAGAVLGKAVLGVNTHQNTDLFSLEAFRDITRTEDETLFNVENIAKEKKLNIELEEMRKKQKKIEIEKGKESIENQQTINAMYGKIKELEKVKANKQKYKKYLEIKNKYRGQPDARKLRLAEYNDLKEQEGKLMQEHSLHFSNEEYDKAVEVWGEIVEIQEGIEINELFLGKRKLPNNKGFFYNLFSNLIQVRDYLNKIRDNSNKGPEDKASKIWLEKSSNEIRELVGPDAVRRFEADRKLEKKFEQIEKEKAIEEYFNSIPIQKNSVSNKLSKSSTPSVTPVQKSIPHVQENYNNHHSKNLGPISLFDKDRSQKLNKLNYADMSEYFARKNNSMIGMSTEKPDQFNKNQMTTTTVAGGMLTVDHASMAMTQNVRNYLDQFDLSPYGAKMMGTLADGILEGSPVVVTSLEAALNPIHQLLPASDAEKGPLSRLSWHGEMIVRTLSGGLLNMKNYFYNAVRYLLFPVEETFGKNGFKHNMKSLSRESIKAHQEMKTTKIIDYLPYSRKRSFHQDGSTVNALDRFLIRWNNILANSIHILPKKTRQDHNIEELLNRNFNTGSVGGRKRFASGIVFNINPAIYMTPGYGNPEEIRQAAYAGTMASLEHIRKHIDALHQEDLRLSYGA